MVSNDLIVVTPEERKATSSCLFFGFLNHECVRFERLLATQIRNPTYFSERREKKKTQKNKETSERSLSGKTLTASLAGDDETGEFVSFSL